MGRRSNVQEQGTAYPGNAAVDWGYNALGEVTLHNHSANANDRVFAFDGIGNRTKGAVGTAIPDRPKRGDGCRNARYNNCLLFGPCKDK